MSEDVVEVMARGMKALIYDSWPSFPSANGLSQAALSALTEGGWAVVPVSASNDMIMAGGEAIHEHADLTMLTAFKAWNAMILAARDHAPTTCAAKDRGSSVAESGGTALPKSEGQSPAGDIAWITVPADPTPAMLAAGEDQLSDPIHPTGPDGEEGDWVSPAQGIWWMMWQAAPKPPAEHDAGQPSEASTAAPATDTPNTSSLPNTIREGE